jgi:hypothetical protein
MRVIICIYGFKSATEMLEITMFNFGFAFNFEVE